MMPTKAIFLGVLAATITACSAAESAPKANSEAAASAAVNAPATESLAPDTSYKDAPSGVYSLDKTHGYIVFNYSHQDYSKPFLRWRDWDSALTWDNENPENSSVAVTIQTAGIDSGVDIFDEHLRSDGWFNVETYPEITFVSTSLTKLSDVHGTMTGDLTAMGVTKPVTLDVTFNKAAEGRQPGTHKIGFSARSHILRSDWNLGKYAPAVSDDVELIVEVEYVHTADAE